MNAKEFLKSKGNTAQPKVRFLNAGASTMVPLDELLDEYAAQREDNKVITKPAASKPGGKPAKAAAKKASKN